MTYLGDKLGHELDYAGIIAKLPYKHNNLFHLDFPLVILSKDVIDQPAKIDIVSKFVHACVFFCRFESFFQSCRLTVT